MGLFDFLKPKKELPEADRKWNLMWDLWTQGKVASPHAELMEYDSQVNNGGHSQYFFNTANCGDLKASVEVLFSILPEPLLENLKRSYEAFAAQKEIDDDVNDDLFEQCDDIFYENEQMLLNILRAYADQLSL